MKALKLIYQRKDYPIRCSINFLVSGLFILFLFSACSSTKPYIAENPASQRFRDVTRRFPAEKLFVTQASFLRGNQDALSDLVILDQAKNELYILINQNKKGFSRKLVGPWSQKNKE